MIHLTAGLIVPLLALKQVFGWQEIKQNLVYIYVTVFACAIPMTLLATFNYEFPSLLGGAIGFCCFHLDGKENIGLTVDQKGSDSRSSTC